MNLFKIDSYLKYVTYNQIIPCANISIGTSKELIYFKSYGNRQLYPTIEAANTETLFDIASLTKIIATWPAIMYMIENSLLELSTSLEDIWGQTVSPPYRIITIENLLTHTSGITAQTYLKQYGEDRLKIINGLLSAPLSALPNSTVIYSNRGFILLGLIIEQLTHQSLSQFVRTNIWEPLGMANTTFSPIINQSNIAATEINVPSKTPLKGIVHDENAQLLGGIAGHAGVFSTLNDISIFCQNLLQSHPKMLHPNTLLRKRQIRTCSEIFGVLL